MSRLTWDSARARSGSLRGYHPLRPNFPVRFARLRLVPWRGPSTPVPKNRFGLFPVRSPLLGESHMMSFPPGTKMFQFPGLASAKGGYRGSLPDGFSHSDSRGSKAACASPRIFAACRVLRRRSMPRHPPRALFRLVPNCPVRSRGRNRVPAEPHALRCARISHARYELIPCSPPRLLSDGGRSHGLSLASALLTSNPLPAALRPLGSSGANPRDICSARGPFFLLERR